jgi:hypothetical protein
MFGGIASFEDTWITTSWNSRVKNLALHAREKGTRVIIPWISYTHGVWFGSASMGMIPLYIRLYISSLWVLRSLQQLS